MRQYAYRVLAVICVLHVSGLHWLAIQATAWAGMLVTRAQETTMVEAVRTTFDGDHPCPLCQAVQEGQSREQESDSAAALDSVLKLTFVRPSAVSLPAPKANGLHYSEESAGAILRLDTPPTPPPRVA